MRDYEILKKVLDLLKYDSNDITDAICDLANEIEQEIDKKNEPLTLEELKQMDGEPVYFTWDNIGWSKVVLLDGDPQIAAFVDRGYGYQTSLHIPTDIAGISYAYRYKPEESK